MNYINYSHANATNFSLQHITPFNLNETPIKNISHLLSKPSIETDCPIQYISRLEPDSKKYSTCNPDENLSLQDRVNSMFWKDQLSIAPPRPKKSNPIQKEKAENWINAHCPSQRETARKFLSVTRHITQEEFENSLKSSVEQFNKWLQNQPSQEYNLLVTPKASYKSNRWVAELALPFLSILPKQVLTYYTLPDPLEKDSIDFLKSDTAKIIVFFDDAAYSGLQSSTSIRSIFHNLLHYKILDKYSSYQIVLITPFVSTKALWVFHNKTLQEHKNSLKYNPEHTPNLSGVLHKNALLIYDQLLHPLASFISNSECKNLELDSWECSHAPVYFDHKIADPLSTYERAYYFGAPFEKTDENCLGENLEIAKANTQFIERIEKPYGRKATPL